MNVVRGEGRTRHFPACIILSAACMVMAVTMSSCAKEEISLSIVDGAEETTVTAYVGDTVEDVLEDAEITVGENDIVTPELDYKIQSEDSTITIDRYAEVTVIDGEDTYTVGLAGKTVQDALDEAGIVLGENDEVNQELDALLTDGMEIDVNRVYNIALVLDGESSDVMSGAPTVGDMITELAIEIGPDDEISPDQDTPLSEELKVVIKRTRTEQVVEEEEVAYDTVYQNSSSLYEGETAVDQEGVNGVKEVTYEVTYVNGEETGREVVNEEVTVEPVNRVVLQGTKQYQSSSSGSSSSSGGSSGGKTEVNRNTIYDCDGSGHGYYEIYYSDGSVDYVDF